MMAEAPPPGLTPLLPPSMSSKVSVRIAGKTTLLRPIAPGKGNATNVGNMSMSILTALFALQRLTIRRTEALIIVWCLLMMRLSCSMVATSLRRG